nr:tetraacyldisaccharide 4'-kinase [uncultured bacterium]
MRLLAPLYARGASWRRAWYARHPEARRRLARPVISVGNLVVGGSGKTPVVAALARWLLSEGQRPSILSRGYARKHSGDGVVVVSDPGRVLAPVEQSGDEPQMLARALPGVPVLAGPDRFVAGCIAERRFDCTVHLLDDGFQHFPLHRDVDLVLVSSDDLRDSVLPAGRLREPLEAARAADALLVTGRDGDPAEIAARLRVAHAFEVIASFGAPRSLKPYGAAVDPIEPATRVLAVAGIARPERFYSAARAQGWDVVAELSYRDHHWFSEGDLARIGDRALAAGAQRILTTEKDAVRLLALADDVLDSFAYLPMTVAIEPADEFRSFIKSRLVCSA